MDVEGPSSVLCPALLPGQVVLGYTERLVKHEPVREPASDVLLGFCFKFPVEFLL